MDAMTAAFIGGSVFGLSFGTVFGLGSRGFLILIRRETDRERRTLLDLAREDGYQAGMGCARRSYLATLRGLFSLAARQASATRLTDPELAALAAAQSILTGTGAEAEDELNQLERIAAHGEREALLA